MFLQPGKVLVLDAFSGKVTTLDVPDSHLEGGGWTSDGVSIIAWSRSLQWRLSPTTGVVHRLGQVGANPGSHEVVVDVEGNVRVLEFDGKGNNSRTIGGPRVLSQVWGSTFTNAGGRLATAGFLNQPAEVLANNQRPDEISTRSSRWREMAPPGAPASRAEHAGVAAGCCEVLGWAYNDQVLIRWSGTQLLAWNVSTGALRRVSTLPGPAEGSPMGRAGLTVALAP